MRRRNAIPRTERQAEARERALATLALMRREGLSLKLAATAERIAPRTVKRYVGSALRQKGRGERYQPTAYDRIRRTLHVVTPEGMQTVTVRDSRQATKLAEYWVAVHRYLETGDASALRKFRGKHTTDASGARVQLLTDLDDLDRLGSAGVLSFESLYAKAVKMPKKPPQRDPIGAYGRKATAERRVGIGAQCACGEARPEALIAGSNPMICAACQRIARGQRTNDEHHFAGRANSPETIQIPVNDHRAWLTPAQLDWPKTTRENPNGSPFIAAAAHLRGFLDIILYLVKVLLWIADMLEKADAFLTKKLGLKWWVGTELGQFPPKR